MLIATHIYRRILCTRGITRKFWAAARRALIRIGNDPMCVLSVHEKKLAMPLSHALPTYLEAYQHYDRLPGRISEYIHLTQSRIKCIDVGANIGDSIAAFYKSDKDLFLAIEPNPRFLQYLVANWSWNRNVKISSNICSSKSVRGKFAITQSAGTASILESTTGVVLTGEPLDKIVENFPEFLDVDVLKIDTDGHDFEVIFGAEKIISSCHPAVLFECDAFGNESYLEDCLNVLRLFRSNGYGYCLIYDNFGCLLGKYSLEDFTSFNRLIFFQLTSRFYYFDILVMRDADLLGFYKCEVDYFVEAMGNIPLQREAFSAAGV